MKQTSTATCASRFISESEPYCMSARTTMVLGQPSWRLASSDVELFVTELGGQVAPVTFDLGGKPIAPMAVAPWAQESLASTVPACLRALRGDFFCMPFGGNATPFLGEHHPPHGETANGRWTFESLEQRPKRTTLHLSLETEVRRGRVDKRISLVDGHNAVYSRHSISGMSGPMSLGHHAMLKCPASPGSGLISLSSFRFGQVYPEPVERPESGGDSCLLPGARFHSLAEVPTTLGESTDLSRYPARRGYEDVVMLVSEPTLPFAWTAVSFPSQGYVWFALKNPQVLRQTLLWFSNGGRHYAPWNGRHVDVLGVEELTSYFFTGLAESIHPNAISDAGDPTSLTLDPNKTLEVSTIMAAARIPERFGRVADIVPAPDGVVLHSGTAESVHAPLDLAFLQSWAS
jgi:hypothetical protein